jgi:hypothetical protein
MAALPVDQVGMVSHKILFLPWVLIACPAIGVVSAWLIDPESDASILLLSLGLPSALAFVGGVCLRAGLEWIVVGILLAPVGGYVAI